MGVEAKLSNMSRRCAGRSMELFGKITHNTRWQLAGRTIWMSACDDEAREKAKDAAKAMEAVAAYGLGGQLMPQARATASGQMPPAGAPRFSTRRTGR